MKNFMLHEVFLGWSSQREWDGHGK